MAIIIAFYFKYPQKVKKIEYENFESNNKEVRNLEIQKAELTFNFYKDRYLNLREIYKDHPKNKDLKEAELKYKLQEIDLKIIKILSDIEN